MNLDDKLVMAAISGALLGTAACASSQQPAETPVAEGEAAAAHAMPAEAMSDGKHACKGQNACKGQGGCKTDKNGCAGQNACKGQGGCKTS